MKRGVGRPRKISFARNRKYSVLLSEKADLLFRKMCKVRGGASWLHEYVSENIVRDFELDPEEYLKFQMLCLAQKRDEMQHDIEIQFHAVANQLQELRIAKKTKEAEKLLGNK